MVFEEGLCLKALVILVCAKLAEYLFVQRILEVYLVVLQLLQYVVAYGRVKQRVFAVADNHL